MRKLRHNLDIAIRDNSLSHIRLEIQKNKILIDRYLGYYLDLCEEFNSIDACVTIFDCITKNNVTDIHQLSMVEFQSIISRWIKKEKNDLLKAIIDRNYFIKSLDVHINKAILIHSCKDNNKDIFSYCLPFIQSIYITEEEIIYLILKNKNTIMLDYVFENHFDIANRAKNSFKHDELYNKLIMKNKIVDF